MGVLRFLTFNIHGSYNLGGERDLKRLHAVLEKYQVDIAVLQEMETRPSKGGTATDVNELAGGQLPYHLPGPSIKEGQGWYGNLILSRYPIIRAQAHSLETARFYEPRNALDALIKTPWGNVRVIGTHLSVVPGQRWGEVENLLKLVKLVEEEEASPLFIMGDINEWRSKSKLLTHLNNLFIPVPSQPTFPSFHPVFRLDRVWHDAPHLTVTARTLMDKDIRKLSDHLPVLAEVENFFTRPTL